MEAFVHHLREDFFDGLNPFSRCDVGYAQKGGRDYGDVTPVPLGSKESHDPPTVSGWLRAKSLHSIMNEHKMIEMIV